MKPNKELRWMRLDNAAKLYPASKRKKWINRFRVSVCLSEDIDVVVLNQAIATIIRRFPSICVRLRRGLFWYYIEEIAKPPVAVPDAAYPMEHIEYADIKRCSFKVLYYKNRIAIEIFHAVTDGNGGMIFLKTLTAEYLRLKYTVQIPPEEGVLDLNEAPKPEEYEDSFRKYVGQVKKSHKATNAYRLHGTKELSGFNYATTGIMDIDAVKSVAKEKKVSITIFLVAVMIESIAQLQKKDVPKQSHRKPIKVFVPVNLRNIYPSKTLRNFVLFCTPGITPDLGDYSFDEILVQVYHQMGKDITEKELNSKFTGNVTAEDVFMLKVMPLFVKNFALRIIYNLRGERKTCISLSNIGVVSIPEEMKPYVTRFDLVIGLQATNPLNCGMLSYQDKLYFNFIRNIKESSLEQIFFHNLVEHGIPVTVEANHM